MKNYSSHIPTTGTDKFGTFIKYYKISQLIHTQSIANSVSNETAIHCVLQNRASPNSLSQNLPVSLIFVS